MAEQMPDLAALFLLYCADFAENICCNMRTIPYHAARTEGGR